MMKTSRFVVRALALAAILAAGCKAEKSALDSVVASTPMPRGHAAAVGGGSAAGPTAPAEPAEDLDSHAILDRKDTAPEVQVKHVLIGWKDLAAAYRGHMDPRAEGRSNADAAKLAREVYDRAQKGEDFDKLVKELSEDPGSQSGEPYTIAADTAFVPEFKQLGLRLMLNEVGIVKTSYGYHIIKRVPPPPPDPLESADILARPAEPGPVSVQHILIGWKGAPAARTATRTKEEADKIAKDTLDKVRAGGDMTALMKELSEDPGSKDTGRAYEVATDTQFVEPFKKLALRLKVGEAGLVKSPFGWHVIKRAAPPPPDALESADILAREPVTQLAKVKHILLSYAETHGEDPRGQKRDRATLEKLVKDTVAKLKGGAKIEPLMAELSEDPGSAKTGTSYDATPDAGLVEPFKKLSLRLKPGEVGVVKTEFGYHIIQRVDGMPGVDAGSAAKAPPAEKPAEKPAPAPKAPAEKAAPAPAAGSGSAAK
jgi:parvulin-like peptidyl-prolyl isomerase